MLVSSSFFPILGLLFLSRATALCGDFESYDAKRGEYEKDLMEAEESYESLSLEVRWAEDRLKVMKEFLSSGNSGNDVKSSRPVSHEEHTEITAMMFDAIAEDQEATDGDIESMKRVFANQIEIATQLVGSSMVRSMIERMERTELAGYSEAKLDLDSLGSFVKTLSQLLQDLDKSMRKERKDCIALLLKEKERSMWDLKRIERDIGLLSRKFQFVKGGIDAYVLDMVPAGKQWVMVLNPPYLLAPGTTRALLMELFKLPDQGLTVQTVKKHLIRGIDSLFTKHVIHLDAVISGLIADLPQVQRELMNVLEDRKKLTMQYNSRVQARLDKLTQTVVV